MKKTLSVLAVLGLVSIIGSQSANAFEWSSLNPAYWGHCPKCEKKKADCGCKKFKKCDPFQKLQTPCPTGAAAPCVKKEPCNPCQKAIPQQKPCDACDRLQEMNK